MMQEVMCLYWHDMGPQEQCFRKLKQRFIWWETHAISSQSLCSALRRGNSMKSR
jgi:hypothetical protein